MNEDERGPRRLAVGRRRAAELLSISPNRLDYLRRIGVVRAVKLDDDAVHWRYPVADLERLIDETGSPR
jgi:hypothetical protein